MVDSIPDAHKTGGVTIKDEPSRSLCSAAKALARWVYDQLSNLWESITRWTGLSSSPLSSTKQIRAGQVETKNRSLSSIFWNPLPNPLSKESVEKEIGEKVIEVIPKQIEFIMKEIDNSSYCPLIFLHIFLKMRGDIESKSLFLRVFLEKSVEATSYQGRLQEIINRYLKDKKFFSIQIDIVAAQRIQDVEGKVAVLCSNNLFFFNGGKILNDPRIEGANYVSIFEGILKELCHCSEQLVGKATELLNGEYVSEEVLDLKFSTNDNLVPYVFPNAGEKQVEIT